MNKINTYFLALMIIVGGFLGGGLGYHNYASNNVTIEADTGTTNIGKVSSEVLTYRMKVVDADGLDSQDLTGFMNLGVVSPSEFMPPFLQSALGDSFSYDATLKATTAIVIETSVTYTGNKGAAKKVIDSRSLVFHTGTTVKEIIADVTLHTKNVVKIYKENHSYLSKE